MIGATCLAALGVLDARAAEQNAPTAVCKAGWGQVVVYAGPRRDGRCVVKGPGIYPSMAAIGLGSPMRSLDLGSFTDAAICRRQPASLEVECDKVIVSESGLPERPDHAWTWLQVVDARAARPKRSCNACPPTTRWR